MTVLRSIWLSVGRDCLIAVLAGSSWLLGDAVGRAAATMVIVALGS